MPLSRQPVSKLAYTTREVRIATGLGRSAVLEAIQTGQLEARRVTPGRAGKYLVSARSLEAFLGFSADPEPASDAAGDPEPGNAAVIDPEASSPAQPVPDGPATPPVTEQ